MGGAIEQNRSHFPNGLSVPAPRKESCMELSGTKSDGLNEIPVAGSTTTSSVPTAAAKQTHAHMTTAQIAIAVQEP